MHAGRRGGEHTVPAVTVTQKDFALLVDTYCRPRGDEEAGQVGEGDVDGRGGEGDVERSTQGQEMAVGMEKRQEQRQRFGVRATQMALRKMKAVVPEGALEASAHRAAFVADEDGGRRVADEEEGGRVPLFYPPLPAPVDWQPELGGANTPRQRKRGGEGGEGFEFMHASPDAEPPSHPDNVLCVSHAHTLKSRVRDWAWLSLTVLCLCTHTRRTTPKMLKPMQAKPTLKKRSITGKNGTPGATSSRWPLRRDSPLGRSTSPRLSAHRLMAFPWVGAEHQRLKRCS